MFGSGTLDTVIGLVFIFALVSMLVTIVNEMIAASLMSRAKWLRFGIERLVGSQWMEKVYAHPLIEGTARKKKTWVRERGPSYIPSRSFANVLMSVIQEDSNAIAECQKALRDALDSAANAGATVASLKLQLSGTADQMQASSGIQAAVAGGLLRHLDAIGDSNARPWLGEVEARVKELEKVGRPELEELLQALQQLVADGVATHAGIEELRQRFDHAVNTLLTGSATMVLREELTAMGKRLQGRYTVADAYADIHWFIDGMSARYVRQMLEALPAGDLQKILLTLFDDAKGNADKLKENIEVWFNNSMDRVNGWYKRRSQLVIAILGVGVAIALNIDTILILRHLQTYPAVRQAVSHQAIQFAQKTPRPAEGAPAAADPAGLVEQFDALQTKLTELSVPIGWVSKANAVQDQNGQVLPTNLTTFFDCLKQHTLGWLLTALAATLGAPFWFDMLNRVISIRAAGKPPEEEPRPPKAVSVPVEPGQSQQEADRLRQGGPRWR